MTLDELFNRGVDEIIVKDSFEKKLKEGKKLRIKMGFDPTKPDLHLGHMVGLRILKKLQDEGHTIIFIIGDFTTKIGDPSGRNSSRPVLTDKEIEDNAKTYFNQVSKILDVNKAEIVYNSKWFNQMGLPGIIKLMSYFTVANIIEREDFQKRMAEKADIGMHELLYPMMQAFDSVQVKADVEFGGVDQKLNMLAGRDLQKKVSQPPQDVVMVKLLVGLDGKNKMSKSLNNYIGITDSANDMYGKVMSIPDSVIVDYFKLCTDVKMSTIELIEKELKEDKRNPRDIKADLAKIITGMYTSAEEAEVAEAEFNRVVRGGEAPSDMTEREVVLGESRLDNLLVALELVTSKSEARRLIEQGGVEVDNVKITNPEEAIEPKDGMVIKAGKRNFAKIRKVDGE